jgi:hypothetical protein
MSSQYSPFPGPVPPENNPPINPQYFAPSVFFITALTLGSNTLITTNINHNYVIGQLIRTLIPDPYGTYQINEQTGYVVSIPSANQVLVTINSVNADTFISNPTLSLQKPQIVAVGDIANGTTNGTGRSNNGLYVPGAFINISP